MLPDNNPRKLKIYSKLRFRENDTITVPEIRLMGNWLEKLGFVEGADISIQQESNKLIITLVEEKESPETPAKASQGRKSKYRKKITPEPHPVEELFMRIYRSGSV